MRKAVNQLEIEYPKGIKWTKQRKEVYQILSDTMEPLSAQQIFRKMVEKEEEEMCALSTVYRILSAFEEKGLVSSTTWLGEDQVVYELERGEHTHYAVCLRCHKRIVLHSCPLTIGHMGHRHSDDEEELGDFTVISHKIELYGYCESCRNK